MTNDFPFYPSQDDIDDINAIRAKNDLPPVQRESIRTARDWLRVCQENDVAAEANEVSDFVR